MKSPVFFLPPWVKTSDPASFAQYTVLNRFPAIVSRVIADNDYPAQVIADLQALMDEVALGGNVTPLSDSFPDSAAWTRQLEAQPGFNWLELIWYFAEAFFYQRILDAAGYFKPGEWMGKDPYWKQKQAQIAADVRVLASVYQQFENLNPLDEFDLILHSALWGNRADLSMTALIGGSSTPGLSTLAEREFILTDHTVETRTFLANGVQSVDVINDNAGSDSLFDLVLADFLLRHGWSQHVRFHLKDRPFFISDAMPVDIEQTIQVLQGSPSQTVCNLGQRLSSYLLSGQLVLKSDAFWSSGDVFESLPQHLAQDMGQADLLIFKGDANYRRLIGERYWAYDTPLETATDYFPFSFLALRTIKCEILAGVSRETADHLQALRQKDQLTFVNGKYGLIQLRLLPSRSAA